MSGNYGGWGNQPGWGPPPQHGYPGYPGYPPPQKRGGLRPWHFLVGGGLLLLLMMVLCGGGVAWLFVSRMNSDDVAMETVPDSGAAVPYQYEPPRPLPPTESSGSTVGEEERVAPGDSTSAESDLPPGVRPLFIYVPPRGPSSRPRPGEEELPLPPQVQTSGWRVKVDPLVGEPAQVPERFEFSGGSQFKQLNWPWPQLVLYGRVPGGNLPGIVHQIWDLTTGKGIAAFPKKRFTTDEHGPLAISPDGARAAMITDSFPGKQVVVASLKTGDVEKTLDLSLDKPETLRFLNNDRLMAAERMSTNTDPLGVQIFSIAEEKSLSLGNKYKISDSSLCAVSPSGKYLAMRTYGMEPAVLVFDTESGALAGEMKLTFNASHRGIVGIGFSPDGKRLACVVRGEERTCYLAGVDIPSGERAFSHFLSCGFEPRSTRDIPALQWLPDSRRCLLFGWEVIDCQSGAKLATPAADQLASLRPGQADDLRGAWLFGNRLLLMRRSNVLFSVDLDTEQIAAKAADVSAPADAPLTPIDLTGVESVAEEPAGSWNVPLSSPPEIDSPVHLKLPAKEGDAFFGKSSEGAAPGDFNAVCYGKAPYSTVLLSRFSPEYLEGVRPVYRFDLRTAASFAPFSLPRACELAALSDAREVLTVNRKTESRVDLWSAVGGKHIRGWQPFEGESGDAGKVAWADFTVDGRVLTLSKSGELICWADEAPRAVYRRRFETLVAPLTNSAKTWLMGYDGRGFTVLDTVTGRNLGFIESPGREVSAVALRGDDRMLAAVLKTDEGTDMLCICNLKDGSVVSRFAPNNPIADPVWFGENQLLTKSGALIDVFAGLHAWDFTMPSGGKLAAFGGCVWLLEEEAVTGCKLADLSSGRDLILALAPGAQYLFRPGDEIGLASGDEFTRSAESCITNADYKFNKNAARKLRCYITSEKTGRKLAFGSGIFRRRPDDVVVDEVALKGHVELLDSSGRVVWTKEYHTSMPRVLFGRRSRGDAASALAQSHRESCIQELAFVQLPRQIVSFGKTTVGLPGRSSMKEELHGKEESPSP
jgi:hypothetical protein